MNATSGVLTNIGVQPSNTLGTSGILTGIAYYSQSFNPTAALVTVGGRVTTESRRGISRARVTLTDLNGETRTVLSNSFGYYRFDEVRAGETYVLEVRHKRYQFSPQVLTVGEAVADLNFVADDFH